MISAWENTISSYTEGNTSLFGKYIREMVLYLRVAVSVVDWGSELLWNPAFLARSTCRFILILKQRDLNLYFVIWNLDLLGVRSQRANVWSNTYTDWKGIVRFSPHYKPKYHQVKINFSEPKSYISRPYWNQLRKMNLWCVRLGINPSSLIILCVALSTEVRRSLPRSWLRILYL